MDIKRLTIGYLNHLILFSGWWFSGCPPVSGGSVQLTSDNFDKLIDSAEIGIILFGADWCPFSSQLEPIMDIVHGRFEQNSTLVHEVVFLNFYADWCHFSKILAPIFDEAAQNVADKLVGDSRYLFGKVDCDQETALASRFHISKYPTLKLITNGQIAKKEYRGQRSVDALVEFVIDQLKDPIKILESFAHVDNIEEKSRVVIGYFEMMESPQYETFRKVSKTLRDSCEFYAGIGEVHIEQRLNGDNVVHRPSRTKYGVANVPYTGALHEHTELIAWATELCIPLVRDITFENAEELTEEGLPFLILFHHPDDNDIVNKYAHEVKKQLSGDKGSINCLTADGIKFAHPLNHLGKSQKDLPLIAIDSFRHMYLFPDTNLMTEEGKLKQFVDDLYSGKLHREFHYGPDPIEIAHHPENKQTVPGQVQSTSPPESTFKKLAPSKNRYTLLRDEL